jgi:membrane protease YdiL (CAAX protease family)
MDLCPEGVLKVGPRYIFCDWAGCTDCGTCVDACGTGAITPVAVAGSTPRRSSAAKSDSSRSRRSPGKAQDRSAAGEGRPQRRRAASADAPWSLAEVAAALTVALALLVAKNALLGSEGVSGLPVRSLVWARAGTLTVYYGLMLAFLVWLVRRRGSDFVSAFTLKAFAPVYALWTVAVVLLGWFVYITYAFIVRALGWEPPPSAVSDLTDVFGPDAIGLGLAIVMVVLVGPFVEELVFRGMVLPFASSRWGVAAGTAASAILFAASHFSLWRLVPLALLGVALAWLRTSSHSLLPSIAAHAIYNAVAVAAAFYVAGVL